MQIPENEYSLPLVEAVQKATGRRPHLSTVLRWCQRPNRYGIRLESWLVGGRRVTSVERVRLYTERTTEAADKDTSDGISSQSTVAHSAALRDLQSEYPEVKPAAQYRKPPTPTHG